MQAPSTVIAGQTFSVTVGPFRKPKTGFVGIWPPGAGSMYAVRSFDDWYNAGSLFAKSAVFSGRTTATVTITAPTQWTTPTQFSLQTIVPDDGGTLEMQTLTITPAPAAEPTFTIPREPTSASPPPVSTMPVLNPWNPGGAVYTPPNPEPAASDGAKLSMQGTDLQNYYVANAGPGMLAATAFVIDHEHQLAAIGSSTHPTTAYTPPPTEPAASDGEKLSMQSADVQAYYVQKYGPGFLAATGFVNERNASLGTSIPGGSSVVLPAGPGAGGADTGLIGGGGGFSSTPPMPTTSAAGGPPPTVGALVQQLEGNTPLLIAGAVGLYFLLGGQIPSFRHRR